MLHKDQSKLAMVAVVPDGGASLEQMCERQWPGRPEMVEYAQMMADSSQDWSNSIQCPMLELRTGSASGGTSTSRFARGKGSNAARGAQAPPPVPFNARARISSFFRECRDGTDACLRTLTPHVPCRLTTQARHPQVSTTPSL